ncbi:hypothetical protein TAMA11512_08630 [Selenomonas sp. TAMA-11512]|uniref:LCP family protein n=1 Tax=Selenomonas sp. TAMA-11512 TaxID=3095337 RepID=UPI00308AFA40|nr:hypothetical protein TAMA11512_08630 [Selenomonas sp. TAMA-11512]
MTSARENIKRKRKIKTQRRRLKLFRFFVFLLFLTITLSLFGVLSYFIYGVAHEAYQRFDAMYQGYQERRLERNQAVDEKFEGYTNILVIGLDEGADTSGVEATFADSLLFVSMDNATGNVRVINIPGNTLVPYPSGVTGRINGLYGIGGPPLLVQSVHQLLGVSVHHYIALSPSALAELVDILGGIDLYVEDEMDYEDPESGLSIHIQKGYQHVDGDTAQKYLRYRGTALGEVGRLYRQQRFVKAIYEQSFTVDTVSKIPDIVRLFDEKMKTSAEVFDTARLTKVVKSLNAHPPQTSLLPGAVNDYGWQPDAEAIAQKMKELFPEPVTEE